MGITIHYSLRLASRSAATAERTVRALHAASARFARRRQLGAVTPIFPIEEAVMHSERHLVLRNQPDGARLIPVAPLAGWCFMVDVGQGCEPATFGLGRYPSFVHENAHRRRTGFGGAWTFAAFCKTQYASCNGAEHLLRCHRAVIGLILLWRQAGVDVEITDEGEYWPRRNAAALIRRTEALNQFVAALAGATKDAAEADGGPPVRSPIFAHPRFEHLEAEGARKHRALIASLRTGKTP